MIGKTFKKRVSMINPLVCFKDSVLLERVSCRDRGRIRMISLWQARRLIQGKSWKRTAGYSLNVPGGGFAYVRELMAEFRFIMNLMDMH